MDSRRRRGTTMSQRKSSKPFIVTDSQNYSSPISEDPLDEQIRFAIANKRLLQIVYDAHARTVEPHDYGMKNGARRLLTYQVAGGSSSQNLSTMCSLCVSFAQAVASNVKC